MAEIMSQVLDYGRQKQEASKSEIERTIIPASNGNSFQAGQVCEIQVGGNQPMGYFLDWQSSYLKLTVTNNAATAGETLTLTGGAGVYNMISKIEVLSSGYTLCSIDNYNKLLNMLSDMQLSENYKNETGALLAGMAYSEDETANALGGIVLDGAGGTETFCIPLHALPMTASNKYWPLFARDNLRIRITFDSVANGAVAAATVSNSQVVMSPVELVATTVKLNPQSAMALDQMVGGVYRIVTSDYRNSTSSIAAADTTFVANVAFSHLNVDRILFGFFNKENTNLADSNASRDFRSLQQYSFVNNGRHYPARKINVSSNNGAEAFAELINASNALVDVHHAGSLNRNDKYLALNPTGVDNANTGHFLAGINLEQVRQHGTEDSIYSGLRTLGGVTQIEGSFSAAGSDCSLQAFSNFTVIYSLDTKGSNTWVMTS